MSGETPGDLHDELRKKLDKLHADAANHLYVSFLGLWKREDPHTAHDTTAVAGTLVAAMLDVAALVGQDLGMSPEQMRSILDESYERAVAKAPKWS